MEIKNNFNKVPIRFSKFITGSILSCTSITANAQWTATTGIVKTDNNVGVGIATGTRGLLPTISRSSADMMRLTTFKNTFSHALIY